jgi:hypothetical protein
METAATELRVLTTAQVRQLAREARYAGRQHPGDYMLGKLSGDAYHLAEQEQMLPDGGVLAKVTVRLAGRRTSATAYLTMSGDAWKELPLRDDVKRQLEAELTRLEAE